MKKYVIFLILFLSLSIKSFAGWPTAVPTGTALDDFNDAKDTFGVEHSTITGSHSDIINSGDFTIGTSSNAPWLVIKSTGKIEFGSSNTNPYLEITTNTYHTGWSSATYFYSRDGGNLGGMLAMSSATVSLLNAFDTASSTIGTAGQTVFYGDGGNLENVVKKSSPVVTEDISLQGNDVNQIRHLKGKLFGANFNLIILGDTTFPDMYFNVLDINTDGVTQIKYGLGGGAGSDEIRFVCDDSADRMYFPHISTAVGMQFDSTTNGYIYPDDTVQMTAYLPTNNKDSVAFDIPSNAYVTTGIVYWKTPNYDILIETITFSYTNDGTDSVGTDGYDIMLSTGVDDVFESVMTSSTTLQITGDDYVQTNASAMSDSDFPADSTVRIDILAIGSTAGGDPIVINIGFRKND